MKTYCISRGYYAVSSVEIKANSEEEALEKAKKLSDSCWKDCGGDEDVFYQVEWEEPSDVRA